MRGCTLNSLSIQHQTVRGGAVKKADRLREMISDSGPCGELSHSTMPNPLDPTILLAGVIPAQCSVFKSALNPLRLTFKTLPRGLQVHSI